QVSRVRQEFGLNETKQLESRYGTRRHFQMQPWTDRVEVHWADCGQMYITPVSRDHVCFAFITRRPLLRFNDALKNFPALEKRILGMAFSSRELGSITTTRRLKKVASGNVFLIGDASGSVDAVTGEGMAMAFRQASALAEAIDRSDLSFYQAEHDRIMRLPLLMSSVLLLLDRHPALRKKALAALAAGPDCFSRL